MRGTKVASEFAHESEPGEIYVAENRILSGALVVVGDGRRVLFLRNEGTTAEPRLAVETVLEQENPATREQGTDRPGRYAGPREYGGPHGAAPRSGFDQTDWHQLAEDRFAHDIGDALYRISNAFQVECAALGRII